VQPMVLAGSIPSGLDGFVVGRTRCWRRNESFRFLVVGLLVCFCETSREDLSSLLGECGRLGSDLQSCGKTAMHASSLFGLGLTDGDDAHICRELMTSLFLSGLNRTPVSFEGIQRPKIRVQLDKRRSHTWCGNGAPDRF
jgi:hypothetical protein